MQRAILLLAVISLALGVATAADAKKKPPVPAPAPAPAAKPAVPAAKATAAVALSPEQTAFFENRIRPLLASQCLKCHSAAEGKTKGGLALDSREGVLKGGDSGPAVIAGNPDKSPLIRAVRYTDPNLQMPPKGEKLTDAQVADFVTWVKLGAPDPRTGVAKGKYADASAKKTWWAFQPVKLTPPPAVSNKAWPANPVDNFILAKLEEKQLKPSGPADKQVLIRRLYFDLVGLPPTPAEVEAFVADKSPTAYAQLVDKLLASPHYGERWGRHWLDVARYSDTVGDPAKKRESPAYPFAWTYRDYVVKAFNDDKPYDQFIREQIAADRLPNNKDRTTLAALGFITVGDHFDGNRDDIINDRIDVVTKAFNGLTVACARCHDHMFDPIPTTDYYALHGIFSSIEEPRDLPIIAMADKAKYADYLKEKAALDKAQTELVAQAKAAKATKNKGNKKELQKEALQLEVKHDRLDITHPGAPVRAMVVQDVDKPKDSAVYIRGEKENKGELVPRRYLEVFRPANAKPFVSGSGRLELAYSIANKSNPLTARVLVNRAWQHHFGEGFVLTPDDFGTMSTPPSHPELLDYLSTYLTDNGWSVKKLHRLILLSATYQQASTDNPRYAQYDPFNRLLWRQNVRRLEFEPLRDSILAMAGSLDRTLGGHPVNLGGTPASLAKDKTGKAGALLKPQDNYSTRRTLYGYIDRANVAEVLNHFDFAPPEMPNGKRYQTTVPQQALFLMNSPLVIEQARKIVERSDFKSVEDEEKRIAFLYRLIYQRSPTAQEIQLGHAFFDEAPATTQSTSTASTPVRLAATRKFPLPKSTPVALRPLSAWAEYAHALILANEFAFVN